MAASNNNFTLNGPGVETTTPATSGLLKSSNSSSQNIFTPSYTPSTPVKSITTPTGTTTTFHAPTNTYQPLLDYQKTNGGDTSMTGLKSLASQYGISGYTGTDQQNQQLAGLLKSPQSSTGTTSGLMNSTSSPSSSGYTSSNAVVPGNADGSTNLQGLTGQAPAVPQYTANPGLYGQFTTGLANMSQQPSANYTEQQNQANAINQEIENAKAQMAQQTHDINTSGTWTSRALGEQGQANIQNASTLAALGSQYQGATNQLSAANTAQANQQNALGTAAGLAAPITGVGYGTQVYNPTTGTFTSGGSAFQGGQVAGDTALGTQYAQNASAFKQASGVKNNIISFLNTTPLNPSDFTDVNSVIALLSGKTSDPKYAQLSSQINEYLQTLAPILGVGGGDTNYKTELAQGMLNGGMTPQAIAAQLSTIENTAQTKLQIQSTGSGTGNNSSTSTSQPSSSTSGFGWNGI